jgi:ferredoxin--NADP+ reductase
MPHVVTQSCCADASCVVACPVNCIQPGPSEPGFAGAEMVFIDPKACVDCGACVPACPVDAIKPHTWLTEAELPFLELNASYFAEQPHSDRPVLAPLRKRQRISGSRQARVAVVGSGAAGMFAADELLRHPGITVDVIERLDVPYGLVRYGVAPDHRRTRQISKLFRVIEQQPGFAYRLGVEVGRDVSSESLAEEYAAVVYAVGASADRALGIPGEELPGSTSATAVVGWYNGHPDHLDAYVDLGHERVVVIGNGNVALDVARILTLDPATLAGTDIDPAALATLRGSRVREVVVLGRRGPADVAFTLPELIGLAGLEDLDVVVDPGGLELTTDTPKARLLTELARRTVRAARRRIVLRFATTPRQVVGDDRARGLEVERTEPQVQPDGTLTWVGTGETELIEAGLVLRSVGYRGEPVPGLPFDPATGTVPHEQGRVHPGTYVTGWIKRGPNGFLGTNKSCAQESVASLLADLEEGLLDRLPAAGQVHGDEVAVP